MYEYLKTEIDEAFGNSDESEKREKSKNIVKFAVPCPGCQMNEISVKKVLK